MWRLPIAYGAVVAGICAAIMTTPDAGIDQIRAVIRGTAFTSSLPFLAAFTASSVQRLWPSPAGRWLMTNRRYLGLSVAASHLWHLLAILTLVAWSPTFRTAVQPLTIAFG